MLTEEDATKLNNSLKDAFIKMTRSHLAKRESELVQQHYGMSDFWYNSIKDDLKNIEEAKRNLERQNEELAKHCEPFGGIDKALEIIKTVDEVEKNFTISDDEIEDYIDNKEKRDEEYKKLLRKFSIKDRQIWAQCPKCGVDSPLTVTECPYCHSQFLPA